MLLFVVSVAMGMSMLLFVVSVAIGNEHAVVCCVCGHWK